MHDIAFFTSPFDLSRREFFSVQSGQTIRDALIAHNLLSRMDENAVLVMCNGIELLESQWDKVVDDSDIVTLHLLPQGPVVFAWIVANWVTIAYVIVTALYLANIPEPELPGVIPEASPSYSISARGNAARLGSPKPVFYGRVRTWPDLSAQPFTEFEADGDQVLYQLYEVRQGACTINVADMRIEDTPLTDFADYEVEVIQPGEKSSLFSTKMITSNEFNSLEIVEVMTAYVACDVGQRVNMIAVDIIAAGGLFAVDQKNGNIGEASVVFKVEAQEIDDSDNSIGAWVTLSTTKWVGSSPDVIRRSLSYQVSSGRYRVRVVFVSAEGSIIYYNDRWGSWAEYTLQNYRLTWVGLRAMLLDQMPITTTTRIALKIRASEQLGGKSLGRFNCVSTGKLSTWNPSTGWAAPAVTANPAWVFADIARNTVYGGARDDSFIDLPGLYNLAQQLDVEGIRFDGGFDTSTTVWDALTRVSSAAQAVPVDRAGVYYMVRDIPSSPTYMFTHANIVRDSFRISYASVLEETADSVRVNFFDETSDYRTNSLLCKLTGSAGLSPRDVTLFGCTNKDRAYKWGMYLAALNQYRRISVEFDTGIEGYLPFFYDTVSVSHYLVGRDSVAQVSGEVVAFDGVNILTLNEKVNSLVTPYIIIRGLNGSPSSPYPVTVLSDYRVQIAGVFDASQLVFDAGFERPHFMCGEGTQFYARVKINKISPQGNGVYRIGGFVDAPEVYTASNGLPTPPVNVLPSVVNRAPVVKHLSAALSGAVNAPLVTLGWSGSYADYYQVDFSLDAGATWQPLGEGKFLTAYAEHRVAGVVHYRVAGVSVFRGDFETIVVDTSESQFIAPAPVSGVQLASPFVGSVANIIWTSIYGKHHIKIKKSGVVVFAVDIDGTSFEVSAETAAKYNLGRSFDIEVFSIGTNDLLSATAGALSISNPSPGAVTGILTVAGYSQIHLEWNASADTDLAGYQVWMSAASGFTPGAGNLIYDGIDNKLIIRTLSGGTPIIAGTPYYLRVAAYDKFGKTGLTISSEFSSTPLKISAGISASEITGTMVAAGALDMTKFATGIRPPRVVTSLPAIDGTIYKNQDTVTLTTDGLLYRAVGGAWTADIPAAKVSGTLADSQLAALAANKITGQLIDSQIATLAASKVTGQLTDTQIAALAAAKITGQIAGTQITNGSITTPKLAAGAVTTNEIAANTITASNIAANTITGNKIAANAITTDKLFVTTRSGAINDDVYFTDTTAWTLSAGVTFASGTAVSGAVASTYATTSTLNASAISKKFPIDPNKTYLLTANLWAASGNNRFTWLVADYFSSAGTYISSTVAYNGIVTAGVFARYGSQIGFGTSNTIPAGATQVWIYIKFMDNGAGSSSVAQAAQDFRLEETVGSTLIQDGAIVTNKLASNSVTTAKLVANAVTANEILAGAVTTPKIAAGAVTANEIAANTITAAKIAAGAVGATQIAANAITADKLFVSSTGFALNTNPDCSDATGWQLNAASIAAVSYGKSGNYVIRSALAASANAFDSKKIPFDYTKTYRVKAYAVNNGAANGGLYLGVALQDSAGANIGGSSGGTYWYTTTNVTVPGVWTEYIGYIGAGTSLVPTSTAKTMILLALINYGATAGYIEIQDLRIEEVLPGTLIQDGAITTNKVAANAITAGKIAANTITSNEIAANTITGAQVAANSITATNIDSRNLTIKDASGNVIFSAGVPLSSAYADASVANPVSWISGGLMTIKGSTISSGGSWGNLTNYAYAKAGQGGAVVTATATSGAMNSMIGLSQSPTTNTADNYSSIDFAVYLQTSGNFSVYENGSSVGNYGTYAANSVISVVYDGVYVKYLCDGSVRYQRTVSQNLLCFGKFASGNGSDVFKNVDAGPLPSTVNYANANSGITITGGALYGIGAGAGTQVDNTNQQWAQVSGAGRPADNATVGATFGTNISGQITAANASTFIANAAINTAQIGTLNASVITAGSITTDRIQVGAVSSSVVSNGASTNLTVTSSTSSATIASHTLVSANKAINGSSVLCAANLRIQINTTASLASGTYWVTFYGGTVSSDDGAGGNIAGSGYAPQIQLLMYLSSTSTYSFTAALNSSLANSSLTGTRRWMIKNPAVVIATSTGANVANGLSSASVISDANVLEVKV